MGSRTIQKGDVLVAERVFTLEDVRAFMAISGDAGSHHLQPDEKGRIMVHGLLTASVPTRIGASVSYVARRMTWEFLRPVFTGDTVRAELHITDVVTEPGRLKVFMDVVCRNQDGKDVLRGTSDGVVLLPG